jgi:hypothetical protein
MLTVLERLGGTITESEGPTLVVDLATGATSEGLTDGERQILMRLIEAAPRAA